MKDREARAVINLLTQRIHDLQREIKVLRNPHPENCKCDHCSGWTPDHTIMTLKNPMNRGRYGWWED